MWLMKSLAILYEDEGLLAVDKPSGMLSIPDRYDESAPVALAELEPRYGRLFVVHRIDKDTSGVLLYARNPEAHRSLSGQFATREVGKRYLALVRGRAEADAWECDAPLLADADRTHRTIVDLRWGKPAMSRMLVLERFRDYTWIEILPETGRTHQVRVHCAETGFPLVADPLYGDGEPILLSKLKRKWKGDAWEERPLLSRTALHADSIAFRNPSDGRAMKLEAALPKDLAATLAQLRKLQG